MKTVHTMNIGGAIFGGAIILLAFAAFAAVLQAQREYKLPLLNKVAKWLMEITETVHEKGVDTGRWVSPADLLSARERRSELLKRLIDLLSVGYYYLLECNRPFNKYEFEQMASKYIDSFGKYTDKLHDVVEATTEKSWPGDYVDYETEFENETNDFYQYIVRIQEKENS
jgi:hypothetical protein